MPIDLYPNIAKVKRGGVYQNLPGFVQQSGDADIKAMIANSESSTTAQYAHPEGSYFILNDVLYKAIIDIAVNDTIAVGTNCEIAILCNDVSNLKSETTEQSEAIEELKDVLNITDIVAVSKVAQGSVTMIPHINLFVGDTVKLTLDSVANNNIYLYIRYQNGTNYTSRNCPTGSTEISVTLTDNLNDMKIEIFTGATVNPTATVTIIPANFEPTVIEQLNNRISLLAYPSNTVKTIGHRGNMLDAPMNTAPSYIIARQTGITVMENDIDITDDNHFVMWHSGNLHLLGNMVDITGKLMYTDGTDYYWYDSTTSKLYTYANGQYTESVVSISGLTRCNGDNYAVRSGYTYSGNNCTPLPFDVLRRIDFGAYKANKFKGTQIMTFEEWLILCKKLGCGIYIDRKLTYTTETLTTAATLVKQMGLADKSSWLGLSTAEFAVLRSIISDARVGLLGNPSETAVENYAPYNTGRGFFFDGDANTLTAELVQIGQSAGFDVECYYTGYTEANKTAVLSRINELISYGIDGITCDKYTVEEATYDLLFSY